MENDCEIYVDPDEDEVFFGCVSEREKFASAKLVNSTGSTAEDDCKLSEVLDVCNLRNGDEESVENTLRNERSTKIIEEIIVDDRCDSTESQTELKELYKNVNNTSVELEHNYSTPMQQKIDKSILATPKSVVKADRDGGFLKVLSEIALVKAEAEDGRESEEEENKENKLLGSSVPEIKITEATPEKGTAASSPPKSINPELRRFRIIYSSPQNENKTPVESFEGEKNFKNKFLDREKKKSVDLIDLNDFPNNVEIILPEKGIKETETEKAQNQTETKCSEISAVKKPTNLRFSKEAKKIIEVLKKSTADDTLNFTIQEIDVEEEENSFLSPESVPSFDVTVLPNENLKIQQETSSPRVLEKPADNKLTLKCQTTEKERRNLTPVASQGKIHAMKYFSERRIYNQIGSEGKGKCVKKLPLDEKGPITLEKEKGRGMGEAHVTSSRIPVFGGAKSSASRTVLPKTTPSKTPSGKICKNPKFNHIESPINAYIHNKPTSLVLNVKPEVKRDTLTKVWKPQTAGSERKIQEKTSKLKTPGSSVRLPFVEYKSGTPYKIEKKPESRLPRLAPTVMKLIGSHSPKVLRHEGRFYVNSPRKEEGRENSTIVADPNEVSVVVSQPVQKSHTIK